MCAEIACDANVMSYNQEKLVFEQQNPETPGINPETPDQQVRTQKNNIASQSR
jgi:hypothetical protein